jgi:hypothetical protein
LEKNNPQPYTFDTANKLADLIGGHIDRPNLPTTFGAVGNPTNALNPSFGEFAQQLSAILGLPFNPSGQQGASQYNARQFGETYNPPEYRGIRFLLPPGGITPQAPVPGYAGLQQSFLGEMIRRGYPVLGGVGQLQGFPPGFNPAGFGQRQELR